jgi:hypothetical protein
MSTSKILKIASLVCFALATFGVLVGPVTLVPLGLALYVGAELL